MPEAPAATRGFPHLAKRMVASRVLLLLVGASVVAADVKVTVYEGPTECEDAEKVKKGDRLFMHYTGTIDASSETGEPGKQFDSSRGRGQTFDFNIGQGEVIKGWDEGLLGLCKGAKATLVIPPDLGYGAAGAGGAIPGGATLNFDVEVVAIGEAPPPPNLFAALDQDKDGHLTVEEILEHFKDRADFKGELPEGLMDAEDKDKDGKISWEEFSGPKGEAPPSAKDEL